MAKTKKRKMRTDYSDMTTAEIARLPILQGPENDYGELDVYAVDIPADESLVKTRMGYKCRCDGCGKEFKTLYVSTHYFYTIDGWDSISYHECKSAPNSTRSAGSNVRPPQFASAFTMCSNMRSFYVASAVLAASTGKRSITRKEEDGSRQTSSTKIPFSA